VRLRRQTPRHDLAQRAAAWKAGERIRLKGQLDFEPRHLGQQQIDRQEPVIRALVGDDHQRIESPPRWAAANEIRRVLKEGKRPPGSRAPSLKGEKLCHGTIMPKRMPVAMPKVMQQQARGDQPDHSSAVKHRNRCG